MQSLVANIHSSLAVPTTTAQENQVAAHATWELRYINLAALATTTAQTETPLGSMKGKAAMVGAKFIPAAAVTGTATNFFTLTIAARLAATPFTSRTLITYAADTPTTDDAAAWDEKDLFTSAYKSVTAADFNLEEGEVITAAVAKAAAGMTYPISVVVLRFQHRD